MSVDLKAIADTFGTPLYVYDAKVIRESCRTVKGVFEGFDILPTFAVKANNNPALLSVIREEGFGADVVTIGELEAARLAGIEPEKIVWNGNGKTNAEIEHFADAGIAFVNVDSLEELEVWKSLKTSRLPHLLLRVNPDVDPKTHPKISTGLKHHKFGVPIGMSKSLPEGSLEILKGFHVHIGSQVLDPGVFAEAFSTVVELCNEYGMGFLNIGGGWGIPYSPQDPPFDLEAYRKTVLPILRRFRGKLILELGRYIVGPAGVLVLKVNYVKRTPYKTFVVVDGGMNVLMRPTLYDAYHEIRVIGGNGGKVRVDVVGPLCESGDVIALDRELELPKPGDLVVVEDVGAYGYSMANNYNSTTRPAEVLVDGDGVKLIRRRETLDDLFRNVVMDA